MAKYNEVSKILRNLEELKVVPLRKLQQRVDEFVEMAAVNATTILIYHVQEFDYLAGESDSYCSGEARVEALYLERLYSRAIVSDGYSFDPSEEMTWKSKKLWAHSPQLLIEAILKGWARHP